MYRKVIDDNFERIESCTRTFRGHWTISCFTYNGSVQSSNWINISFPSKYPNISFFEKNSPIHAMILCIFVYTKISIRVWWDHNPRIMNISHDNIITSSTCISPVLVNFASIWAIPIFSMSGGNWSKIQIIPRYMPPSRLHQAFLSWRDRCRGCSMP